MANAPKAVTDFICENMAYEIQPCMKLSASSHRHWSDIAQALKQKLRLWNRQRLYKRKLNRCITYADWIANVEKVAAPTHICTDLVTLLLPVDASCSAQFLAVTAKNLQQQSSQHWELLIALDASVNQHIRRLCSELSQSNERIRILELPQNEPPHAQVLHCLKQSTGIWMGLLSVGDQLHPDALALMAEKALQRPGTLLVYADEDVQDATGQRSQHHFKPDWNLDLQISTAYVGRTFLVQQNHLRHLLVGQAETWAEYADELVLQTAEACQQATCIAHVPHVLWHRADAQHVHEQQLSVHVLQAHLNRQDISASVSLTDKGLRRVAYALPSAPAMVSIIVCTRNQFKLLKACIDSIIEKTTYPNYEIIVVNNGSDEPRTLAYLEQLEHQSSNIRVMHDPRPFNYSELNNAAAEIAHGQLLAFLNNDIEVIDDNWLSEMASHAGRADVGCVGAKLLYSNGTVQHAGVLVGGSRNGDDAAVAMHLFRGMEKDAPGYANRAIATQRCMAVTAACMLMRRDVFEQVGGFDSQRLTVAFNDVDLCLRVHTAGFCNVFTPYALLYHHESISRGRDTSPEKIARFKPELEFMQTTWKELLRADCFYNPNFSDHPPGFMLES
jgi:O-antigen biosynthesis protein